MDKLIFSDIIRIPKRKNVNTFNIDKNNQINYWIIYESTYINNFNKCKYTIEDDNINICEIQDFMEYINNIKYNFHGVTSEQFQQQVFTQYLSNLNYKEIENIKTMIKEVFNLDNKNINIIKLYFKCIEIIKSTELNISEMLLSDICNIINNIIINTNVTNPAVLIKLNIQIDKFLGNIPDCLKAYMSQNIISYSFEVKLLDSFKLDFTKALNIILKWDSIYQKTVIASFCNNELLDVYFDNINKKYISQDFTNSDLAYHLVNIFKLVNKIKDNDIDNITNDKTIYYYYESIRTKYNDLLSKNINIMNYLCASIYDFMNNDIDSAIELIKFQKFNNNIIDFIVIYKQYLQKRCINKFNFEKEQKLFIELKDASGKKANKYLETILNCIDDLQISDHINKEIKNLDITIKDPIFKNISYNKNKLNVSILSNILWTDIILYNYNYNPNIPDDIKIYTSIVEKYYNKKYDNRVINISHDNSNIVVKIRNLTLKLSLVYYYILKFISKNDSKKKYLSNIGIDILHNKDTTTYSNFLSSVLNIPEDHINNIIDCLLDKEIIKKDSTNYIFNEDICKEKKRIDLTKIININKDNIIKEIKYDKENLIDCYLIKIVKKENVSFGKYIYLLRKQLCKLFVPNDTMIRNRLTRMIKLEYINFSENDQKYSYIL
jgi:hypothetical protein